ncbi:hypothetical protein QUB68_24950 [Microcoleus sp. A006_D1]|uniref:hypothetical protein n=1 Tax=Microcoleus sp. A006_D1 TaxID=3055267 RepID=UPI002FCFB3EF
MNPSLIAKFEVISTMIHQIKESPEWAEYSTICNAGLTEEDDKYGTSERDLASIENAVVYLLSGISVDEAVTRTIEQTIMFFLANGRFPDSEIL